MSSSDRTNHDDYALLVEHQARVLKARRTMDWVVLRADEVRKGDLFANGATVTKSRKARPGEGKYLPDHYPVDDLWLIACGKGFSTTGTRGRDVVVGRRRSPHNRAVTA